MVDFPGEWRAFMQRGSFLLRSLCFLACIPSGGAILLKVWGLASMAWGGALFLACLPVLLLSYLWARRHDLESARALRLGCWGGLIGTIGYDVVRIPFHLSGFRVFAPIQAYGVWLLDADRSSAITDATGWAYHFSNGISFGVMYALWMGGRHWCWGILWGLTLEAIVLSTPFAGIFSLQGNYPGIAIAYAAHLAYGFPLGTIVYRWQDFDRRFSSLPPAMLAWGAILLAAFTFGSIPGERPRDARSKAGQLQVDGSRLNPTWVRLPAVGTASFVNEGEQSVTLVFPGQNQQLELPARSTTTRNFDKTGIYQCFIKTDRRSISSFVMVEPVEAR